MIEQDYEYVAVIRGNALCLWKWKLQKWMKQRFNYENNDALCLSWSECRMGNTDILQGCAKIEVIYWELRVVYKCEARVWIQMVNTTCMESEGHYMNGEQWKDWSGDAVERFRHLQASEQASESDRNADCHDKYCSPIPVRLRIECNKPMRSVSAAVSRLQCQV